MVVHDNYSFCQITNKKIYYGDYLHGVMRWGCGDVRWRVSRVRGWRWVGMRGCRIQVMESRVGWGHVIVCGAVVSPGGRSSGPPVSASGWSPRPAWPSRCDTGGPGRWSSAGARRPAGSRCSAAWWSLQPGSASRTAPGSASPVCQEDGEPQLWFHFWFHFLLLMLWQQKNWASLFCWIVYFPLGRNAPLFMFNHNQTIKKTNCHKHWLYTDE